MQSTHENMSNEPNILQYQFTAYLIVAIRNRKIQYLKSLSKKWKNEQTTEFREYQELFISETDMLVGLSVLDQLENMTLQQILFRSKKQEQYIFFARILSEKSFGDIANELGLNYKTVTSIYYRMLKRIRDELGGAGV